MRLLTKISLLLLVGALVGGTSAYADVDKDKDKDKKGTQSAERAAVSKSSAIGNCTLGSASKDLDVNNIRARLYNNGALFWRGSGNVYTVPKNGEANSIFASGIWLGGLVGGELRFAGTAYGPFEYWPGPLTDQGDPPADCSQYDRIFSVKREELDAYNQTGQATQDIIDWPWDLGAPVDDGDGNPNNYNLEGGDRPGLIGDQTAWWVMNDAGNTKDWSKTAPMNVELQVTAFAFRTADPLNNTTFYKYKLIYKGSEPLQDAYFGIWSDPDLGNAADDYVGSDTTLGIAYVYNGTDFDAGFDGYGDRPPALAYDFFQGPLIPAEGETWVDPDGTVHENARRIQMEKFVYYNNDSSVIGNPSGSTDDPYNYLRGIWRDGTQMTVGGNGYGGSVPTNYMFPGNPVQREYWSEENTDGAGSRNTPADRRFLLSAGPFTMQPGDTQEIVYGIVWAQSVNRLASVAQMKFDDIFAQGAYNNNFNIPRAPDEPNVSVEPLDEAVSISWSYPSTSNNYLNSYDQRSAFLVDQSPPDGDVTYTFEGYRLIQYNSPFDQNGTVVATYDVPNNVTQVLDTDIDIQTGAVVTKLVANGSDSGVQNHIVIENLTNWREYYFGLQAYAYNGNSQPKIYASSINRFTVVPAKADARKGGTAELAEPNAEAASVRTGGVGDPFGVYVKVANPGAVTGHEYRVRMYKTPFDVDGDGDTVDDDGHAEEVLTYDIVDASTGETKLNGANYIARNGKNVPFGVDLVVIDGLSFSIGTAPPDFKSMIMVANANGPLDPPDMATFAFNASGFPTFNGNDRPSGSQQATTGGSWGFQTGYTSAGASYDAFLARSIRAGWDPVVPYDWEMRFTERCAQSMASGTNLQTGGCYAYDGFAYRGGEIFPVPFELWNIGAGTPDDPSDDYRVIPYVIDWDADGYNLQCFDHGISGGTDDPETDWTYWRRPTNTSPGEAGYLAWEQEAFALPIGPNGFPADGGNQSFFGAQSDAEIMARTVLVNWNGGAVADCAPGRTEPAFDAELPEVGSVIRLVTTKPLAPGDVFAINTAELAPVTNDAETAAAAIDLIGIVPNPYKGSSTYEVSTTADEVRFTNLPDNASIRVFSLSGTLIRTMQLSTFNNRWDLKTDEGLPLASGMYLIHVEVPGVGEKVIKFGVVKKRIQLDLI